MSRGRDDLFLAERLRKDYWRHHKERSELLVYKQRLVDGQRRSDYVNEVRRIEGFLQSHLTHASRLDYLRPRKLELLNRLGMSAVPE